MMTHSNRGTKLQTIYLWRAWQSQPGQNGAAYRGTLTETAPSPVVPVQADHRTAFSESLYGDWLLLGTATGSLVEDMGETLVRDRFGVEWSVEDIIRGNRFRASKA